MDIFSLPMILLYCFLLGATMKLADLFNEHRMKWFKGDALVFGFLWGLFGVLVTLSNPELANITLAMVLAFIVRMRIDYLNHAIASTMIIIAFIWQSAFNLTIFVIFFPIFVVFGGVKDYLGDKRKKIDLIFKINDFLWYYPVPTFIYGLITKSWIMFFSYTICALSYLLIKYGLYYMKAYHKL